MASGEPGRPVATGATRHVPSARAAEQTTATGGAASDVNGLLTKANLHRLRNEWKEAIDCCVAVLRAQPGNQTAHSLLGDLYRDQGRLDEAIQWYRMAIELRPNPSDEAKLVQVERERNQLMAEDAHRQQQGYGPAPEAAAAAADADLKAGTVNLMGVSPHRWLRGIWVVSLSFLVIALIALVNLHSNRHPASAGRNAHLSGGFGGGNSLLPPVKPGSGFASAVPFPDRNPGGMTEPGIPSQNQGAGRTRAAEPPPILQTAPVVNVAPLPANGLVNAPRDPSSLSTRSSLQPMALTGGLSIERTQSLGDGTVAVLVAAPATLAGDTGPAARELILRNLYRAARTGLAESETYTHATVFIQVPASGDTGEIAIAEATVNREGATSAKPDTDSLESLSSHLTGLKWPGQTTPPSDSPDTGAAPTPPADDTQGGQ
jgi:hypothetical protein